MVNINNNRKNGSNCVITSINIPHKFDDSDYFVSVVGVGGEVLGPEEFHENGGFEEDIEQVEAGVEQVEGKQEYAGDHDSPTTSSSSLHLFPHTVPVHHRLLDDSFSPAFSSSSSSSGRNVDGIRSRKDASFYHHVSYHHNNLYDRFRTRVSRGRKQTYRVSGVLNNNNVTATQLDVSQLALEHTDQSIINRILPKELILRVFGYLDIRSLGRAAGASRYWNRLAMDGSNWTAVDCFPWQREVNNSVIGHLARHAGGFLRRLSLFGCSNVTDPAIQLLLEHCSGIEELNLDKCDKLSSQSCKSIGAHGQKLLKLCVESCSKINDEGLIRISQGCPKLIYLNLNWCNEIGDEGLRSVSTGCSMLENLKLSGCQKITNDALSEIAKNCSGLRVLNLHSCSLIKDAGVEHISDNCPYLGTLTLSKCNLLTDTSLIKLSKGCKLLKRLELANCENVSDSGVKALSKGCSQLEKLDLEECSLISDWSLGNLAEGCHKLKDLILSGCDQLTDAGMQSLAGCVPLSHSLESLAFDGCPLLTDASLCHLKALAALRKLDCYDCHSISQSAIKKFEKSHGQVKVQAYFAPETTAGAVNNNQSANINANNPNPQDQRRSIFRFWLCCNF